MKYKIGVLVLLVAMATGCSPYQRVLKNEEVKPKYELLTKYYNQGIKTGRKSRFKRSIRLLEQILPRYIGKPQGEKLAYMYADSYYHLKDYMDASYQFERFTKAYPQSDKAEEAAFKSAKSSYYASPRYSLDQTETHKALKKFQHYISSYPGGDHIGEANELVASLRKKLEKKHFKIAKLYYVQEDWKAAITSMDNFINENPGSSFLEKAYYYRMDAEYQLAINSFKDVMKGRLEKSEKYAQDYLKYYPEGQFVDKVDDKASDVTERLKNL